MSRPVDKVRQIALGLLNAITIDGRLYSEVAPGRLAALSSSDRARAGRLCLDTLRWADRADRMLGPHLRLKPEIPILNVLRLGVVEICHSGAAPHGVVDALVTISKEITPSKSSLVNAVLRRVAERREAWTGLPVPRLPKWLRKPLVAEYGKAVVEAIEAAHARGAAMDLTVVADAEGWAERLKARLLTTGSLRLQEQPNLEILDGFAEGAWWVQDAAAALPARLLGVQAGERALDMCAAPGGKTLQLAATGARVTALDVSPVRARRIEENLKRTGLKAEIVVADATSFEAAELFDAILLDAPCSATGTIRRHPDLPYAKADFDLTALHGLQDALLDRSAALLKPGGRLVYCTCSLLPSEGEDRVMAFLARHENFKVNLPDLPGADAGWQTSGGLRTRPDYWPDTGGLDGFFITLLRKNA